MADGTNRQTEKDCDLCSEVIFLRNEVFEGFPCRLEEPECKSNAKDQTHSQKISERNTGFYL
jgi:hypothetical protein